MTTPHDIIEAVGKAEAATALDVEKASINVQLSRGVLPASWFTVLEEMCSEVGVKCPRDLFSFKVRKRSITASHGSANDSKQGPRA